MIDITYPKLRDDWSLDVVNILAFLGEHNILACSQQICMSWTCFLPRLIPAPQGLLAQRPKKLASEDDVPVMGVISGTNRPNLQYFGRMVHTDGSELPPFTSRVLTIRWEKTKPSLRWRYLPFHTNPFERKDQDAYESKRADPFEPRFFSPMSIIAIVSCAMSLGLAGWALVLGDAVALTGILVMSFTTPLLCVGMRWRPQSMGTFPRKTDQTRHDTVVIKSSNECLTVVECHQSIARLLYFHPENIEYAVSSFTGRGLSGTVGGLTLVGSIVLFGNAVWTMKAALAVTYTVLNLLYWIAAILPVRLSWHMDLVVELSETKHHEHFTDCLWYIIFTTKKTDWAREHVPKTEAWECWLWEAQQHAESDSDCSWDARRALFNIQTYLSREERIRVVS